MSFKLNVDYRDFFDNVNQCKDEVWLLTDGGDKLNLKSTLSQYVYVVMNGELNIGGTVYCEDSQDYSFLESFLNPVIY